MIVAEKKVFYNYFEKFLLEINRLYINFFIMYNWLIISGLTVSPGTRRSEYTRSQLLSMAVTGAG